MQKDTVAEVQSQRRHRQKNGSGTQDHQRTEFKVWLPNCEGVSLASRVALCAAGFVAAVGGGTPRRIQLISSERSSGLLASICVHKTHHALKARGTRRWDGSGVSLSPPVTRKSQKSSARKRNHTHICTQVICLAECHSKTTPCNQIPSLLAQLGGPDPSALRGEYTVRYYFSFPDICGHAEKVSVHLHRRAV